MPTVGVLFIQHRRPRWDTHGSLRSRVRGQLRSGFVSGIKDLRPDIDDAAMAYTEDGFARRIVVGYGLILVGWPADIPFVNLSEIPGGIRPLLRLRTLWQDGTLHFELATPADIANAARDPRSVHPNPPTDPDGAPASLGLGSPRALSRGPPVVVCPTVLDPHTLSVLGEHPTSTQASEATLGVRPRQQRCDVKKERYRPVTNPERKRLRRRKPGVKSARYVLETKIGYVLTNDPIEEFRSPALTRMRQAARFGGGKVVGGVAF